MEVAELAVEAVLVPVALDEDVPPAMANTDAVDCDRVIWVLMLVLDVAVALEEAVEDVDRVLCPVDVRYVYCVPEKSSVGTVESVEKVCEREM